MTTTKFKALWVWRFGRIVRRWWPVAVFIALSLAVQHVVLGSGYDVGGHAAGHLAGASAPFMASAVTCVLVWATPAAFDAGRRDRGLSWYEFADELWQQSSELNAHRKDHPL